MESLEHGKEYGMRAICILSAVYGIRVSEIAHMEIRDGVVEVKTLKQNAKNMENPEVSTRIVEPLNLPNLPNEGQRIISLLESKKLNRYWYWKQLKIDNPYYVVYSMRHSFYGVEVWKLSLQFLAYFESLLCDLKYSFLN